MGRKSLASERRAQILDALYRCISKHGLHNSTIKRIAQEAAVQPSILYHYFVDRDEMVESLLEKVLDDLSASYISETQGAEGSEARFEKAIDFLYGPKMLDEDLANFLHNCMAEVQRNSKVRKSLRNFYQAGRDVLSSLLVETGKASGLSVEEAQDLTCMIFATQDGIVSQGDIYCTRELAKKMPQLTKDLLRLYIKDKTEPRVCDICS